MLIALWNAWNIEHIATHGISRDEAEYVALHAARPFPREIGDDKFLVWGQTLDGRYLQVIFIRPDGDDIDLASLIDVDLFALADEKSEPIYVIHAMDMTDRQKKQLRRRKR